ncbi:MAG: elongation factor Ts [Proteobacteria bacterium]|jgi:elongation factor Ts|nr:translation elongation factor Ts [Alphaproteobacteria bacterium]NCC02893.1 elongation factor Ts [Pseudomonadota bacterium]
MAEITASMVKDLRESTGAGMMDCKKALTESNGDMEAAIDWLRKKGLSAAAKKAGRVAAEGLVAVVAEGKKAVALEVNAETDFVSRNDSFQNFASCAAKIALGVNNIEALKTQAYSGTGRNVGEELTNLIATVGENMNLRRMASLEVGNGIVASYVHNAIAPNLGKIGVLVALESTADAGKLMELGKQIAMHVAAARPEALNIADVDTTALDRERNILSEQARASGKPEEIIAKMVEGRLRKYYEEVVLMEQVFVVDGESKIKDVVAKAGKTLGADVKLSGFVRFQLGEGIEKAVDDFAAEVAKMAG